MCPIKEPNFFALANESVDFKGPGDNITINRFSVTKLVDYQNMFLKGEKHLVVGEASPLYLYSSRAPLLIHELVPNTKMIIVLRSPLERAYSAFLHLVRDGREPISDFFLALTEENRRISNNWEHIWHYRQMSMYYQQVKRYYEKFNINQIRIFLYEELCLNPLSLIMKILEFLNVDSSFIPNISTKYNVCTIPIAERPPLSKESKKMLFQFFYKDIIQLQSLINRDLSHWLRSLE